jgi:hypothetical protein
MSERLVGAVLLLLLAWAFGGMTTSVMAERECRDLGFKTGYSNARLQRFCDPRRMSPPPKLIPIGEARKIASEAP